MNKKIIYITAILILFIYLITLVKENIECINYILVVLSVFIITAVFFKGSLIWICNTFKRILITIGNIFLCRQKNDKVSQDDNEYLSLLDDEIYENVEIDKIKPIKNIIVSHKSDNFFSIALIGGWGSGKSSYIHRLSKELKKEKDACIIININVWELGELSNIISEIEKELDDIIFKFSLFQWTIYFIKSLFIQKYFSILEKYYVKNQFNISMNQTIKNAKDDFSSTLSNSIKNRKIIIFIDELDRVDSKDEIYNIFKTIRYLTSFNNVISITAVDLKQIESKIDNIDYIHKIFNMKYILPRLTKNDIATYYKEVIFKSLKSFTSDDSVQYLEKILFTNIIYNNEKFVIDLIDNYRVMKNSYNDTYSFCSIIKSQKSNWEEYISFNFIFILNLIKAINYKFYTVLLNKETFFIIMESLKKNSVNEYINNISENTLNDDPQIKIVLDKIKQTCSKNEIFLLEVLSKTIGSNNNMMRYYDCYVHYEIIDYLITDKEYIDFCSNTICIKEYYDKKSIFVQYKEKFLKHLVYMISNDLENQEKILNEILKILLNNNENINYIIPERNTGINYGRVQEDESHTVKLLRMIVTKGLINNTNKNILAEFIKKVNDSSIVLLLLVIENYKLCNDDIITLLFENCFANKIMEKNVLLLIEIIRRIEKNEELKSKLFNSLYRYSNGDDILKDRFPSLFLSGLNVENIEKEIEYFSIKFDKFINDNSNFYVYVSKGNGSWQSNNLSGKELKQEIEKENNLHK